MIKFKSIHAGVLLFALILTGLLERKLLPDGAARELGFVGLAALQFIAAKFAELYLPASKDGDK